MDSTKFLNGKVKKTDPFSARLPHHNILPFPEADRREAEEKKSSLSKGSKNALKLVKFKIPKRKKLTEKRAFESLKNEDFLTKVLRIVIGNPNNFPSGCKRLVNK